MSQATMRAKMQVMSVTEGMSQGLGHDQKNGPVKTSERLQLGAVGPNRNYNADGTGDEDNTFSRWTPSANLDITIQNPALFGQFKAGDKFYVDFTRADQPQA